MSDKLFKLFLVVSAILQLISIASSKDEQKVLQDFTLADGFIFDGPAYRSSSLNVNKNLKGFSLSSISTVAPGTLFGRRKISHISTYEHCFKDCIPTMEKMKLVCGSDGVTYDNPKQVHCARMCGKFVQIQHDGPCNYQTATVSSLINANIVSTPSPQVQFFSSCLNSCPKSEDYDPVCGSDGITYDNPDNIKCAQTCGKQITMASDGICTHFVS